MQRSSNCSRALRCAHRAQGGWVRVSSRERDASPGERGGGRRGLEAPFMENIGVPFPQLGVKPRWQGRWWGRTSPIGVIGVAGLLRVPGGRRPYHRALRRRADGGHPGCLPLPARFPAADPAQLAHHPTSRQGPLILRPAVGHHRWGDGPSPMERPRILDPAPDDTLLDDAAAFGRRAVSAAPGAEARQPLGRNDRRHAR